ncbi:MAG: SH3 domain-containing protein [Spirochaetales bacterium]|nr:SH3 domain-containing protein [Spirochaetales bacterium]
MSRWTFWIENIIYDNGRYFVRLYGDSTYQKRINEIDRKGTFLSFIENQNNNFFNLKLIPDGDYLDIYLNNETEKAASLIKVNQNYLAELNNVLKNDTADLSHITWPTRADGSMDYPIPSDVLLQNYNPTHKTIEETSFLSSDSPSAESQLLPVNTDLRWIGKGRDGRIKVLASDGREGWVHGDELELVLTFPDYSAIPAPELPEPAAEVETSTSYPPIDLFDAEPIEMVQPEPKGQAELFGVPVTQKLVLRVLAGGGLFAVVVFLVSKLGKKK